MFKKINFIISLIILVLVFKTVQAQEYFLKRIDNQNWTVPATSIIKLNDNSLMINNRYAVVKTDSTGNMLWARYYVYNMKKLVYGLDGNIYVTGATDSSLVITKIDTNGNIIWSKSFVPNAYQSRFGDAIASTDSSIVICGMAIYYTGGSDIDSSNLMVIKVDYSGSIKNTITFGNELAHYVQPIAILENDTGFTFYGHVFNDTASIIFITNTDSIFNAFQTTNLSLLEEDYVTRIYSDGDGVIIEGTNEFHLYPFITPFLISLDHQQNIIWSRAYDVCDDFIFEPMIVGRLGSNYLICSENVKAELDSAGNFIYYQAYQVPNLTNFQAFTRDNQYIYFTGGKTNAFDWINIARSDTAGYTGCNFYNPSTICTDSLVITIDSINSQSNFVNVISYDIDTFYVWPLATTFIECATNDINQVTQSHLVIHPNPSNGLFQIDLKGMTINTLIKIELVNTLGELLFECESKMPARINLTDQLKNGLYLVKISNDEMNFSSKILITN